MMGCLRGAARQPRDGAILVCSLLAVLLLRFRLFEAYHAVVWLRETHVCLSRVTSKATRFTIVDGVDGKLETNRRDVEIRLCGFSRPLKRQNTVWLCFLVSTGKKRPQAL